MWPSNNESADNETLNAKTADKTKQSAVVEHAGNVWHQLINHVSGIC